MARGKHRPNGAGRVDRETFSQDLMDIPSFRLSATRMSPTTMSASEIERRKYNEMRRGIANLSRSLSKGFPNPYE